MSDDNNHRSDQSVTSHNQSGGITAHTVIGAVPEITKTILCVNVDDGERYACQIQLDLVQAPAGAGLRVEVMEHKGIPIDLELTPLNALIEMVRERSEKSPEHQIVEMAPPLAAKYVATVRADQPIARAEVEARFVSEP